MAETLSRSEAESFVRSYDLLEILLDDPHWGRGFSRLVKIWQSQHRENGLPPCIEDIDLLKVPDLIPGIQSYRQVQSNAGKDAVTIFQGSEVVAFTEDETGKHQIADNIIPPEMAEDWLRYVSFAERWPFPHWVVATTMRVKLGDYHREQSVVLPCSSDGTHIDELIAANFYHKIVTG